MSKSESLAVADEAPRKMLAARGEVLRKPLAGDWNRLVGRAIERAILLAKLTKQDVAHRMGYSDQSALARWISGVETAQLPKLFAIPEMRQPLIVALAECCEADGISIRTVVTLERKLG